MLRPSVKSPLGWVEGLPLLQSALQSEVLIDGAGVREVLQSIRAIASEEERESLLSALEQVDKPFIVSFVNAHAFNIAWDIPDFASSLCASGIVLRDGIGMRFLMKLMGMKTGINMNGTDFIPMIIPHFAGKRVALCGTREPYLSLAAQAVRAMGCEVVLLMDGFQPIDCYIEPLLSSRPDLVILGMGMPKQEALSRQLAARMQHPAVIVNGGAILDFWANRFPRAPRMWQMLHLEWLFRLLQEPKRLWRRYVLGGGLFCLRALRLRVASGGAQGGLQK